MRVPAATLPFRSIILVLLASMSLSSRATTDTAEQLRTCAAELDDALRLACFDRIVGEATHKSPDPATSIAAPDERFGIHGSQLARREAQVEPESVSAKVISIDRQSDGMRRLTLANGQVWVEKQSNPRFLVQPGDAVILKRGALNSYRMITSAGRSLRVTRIQ